MTDADRRPSRLTDNEELALRHFAALRSGDIPEEDAEFEAWLSANDRNAADFQRLETLWSSLDAVKADPRVLAMRENVRRGRRRMPAIAAGFAILAMAGGLALTLLPDRAPDPAPLHAAGRPVTTAIFQTGVGEVSRFALADGSRVTLDAESVLTTSFDGQRRRLILDRGRAYFRVAHDHRPFTVTGPQFRVTATGTSFVVDATRAVQQVGLISGSVIAAAPGSPRLTLAAGRSVAMGRSGQWQVSRLDPAAIQSWMQGKLIFRDEPIGDIAAQLNRYSSRKLVVRGDALARERLNAILKTGDIDTFIAAVTSLDMARVASQRSDRVIIVEK